VCVTASEAVRLEFASWQGYFCLPNQVTTGFTVNPVPCQMGTGDRFPGSKSVVDKIDQSTSLRMRGNTSIAPALLYVKVLV
jgi:hypothetical protein